MKKILPIILISLLLAACNNNNSNNNVVPQEDNNNPSETTTVSLVSIELSGNYQTTFEQGEEFNHDGLVVTAKYSDGTSKVVTNYSITNPSTNNVGEVMVTVTYEENSTGASTAYTITVVKATLESVFSEPYINKQYYLNHIGDIYSVWKEYRGKGVTVAVIDSAFDTTHEEFKFANGKSKISDKSASFTLVNNEVKVGNNVHDLSDSHGTFCAGVVGAAQNNKGIIGVAPESTLMLLKTDKKPKSIEKAFRYAADKSLPSLIKSPSYE